MVLSIFSIFRPFGTVTATFCPVREGYSGRQFLRNSRPSRCPCPPPTSRVYVDWPDHAAGSRAAALDLRHNHAWNKCGEPTFGDEASSVFSSMIDSIQRQHFTSAKLITWVVEKKTASAFGESCCALSVFRQRAAPGDRRDGSRSS